MKTLTFNKNDYKTFEQFFTDLCGKVKSDNNADLNLEHFSTFPLSVRLFYRQERQLTFVLKNFNVQYYRYNRKKDDYRFLDVIEFLEEFSESDPDIKVEIIEENPLPVTQPPIKKEAVFDRKNYSSYKDFYSDICTQLDAKDNFNCIEPTNLGYSADMLSEFLLDYCDENIKFTLINFDKEKISQQKTLDARKYCIILDVLEKFVKKYPNNQIEYRN